MVSLDADRSDDFIRSIPIGHGHVGRGRLLVDDVRWSTATGQIAPSGSCERSCWHQAQIRPRTSNEDLDAYEAKYEFAYTMVGKQSIRVIE